MHICRPKGTRKEVVTRTPKQRITWKGTLWKDLHPSQRISSQWWPSIDKQGKETSNLSLPFLWLLRVPQWPIPAKSQRARKTTDVVHTGLSAPQRAGWRRMESRTGGAERRHKHTQGIHPNLDWNHTRKKLQLLLLQGELANGLPKNLGWRLPKVNNPRWKEKFISFIPVLSLFLHLSTNVEHRGERQIWVHSSLYRNLPWEHPSRYLKAYCVSKTADLTSAARKPTADPGAWAPTSLLSLVIQEEAVGCCCCCLWLEWSEQRPAEPWEKASSVPAAETNACRTESQQAVEEEWTTWFKNR